MDDLLTGLNDSFFDAVPSPDPSPVKPKPVIQRTPLKSKSKIRPKLEPKTEPLVASVGDVDMAALVDGAESWDWDDMELDFLTPKKERGGKTKALTPSTESGYIRETCTRCIVEQVTENEVNGRLQKVCASRYLSAWIHTHLIWK